MARILPLRMFLIKDNLKKPKNGYSVWQKPVKTYDASRAKRFGDV